MSLDVIVFECVMIIIKMFEFILLNINYILNRLIVFIAYKYNK